MKKIDLLKWVDKLLEWSVYLILFVIPFSKSVIEICIPAGIVLLIVKMIATKRYKLPATPANIPLLFIFLTAALSLINSQYMSLSLRALFSKNLKFILLYFLVIEAIDNRTKMMNLLKIGLISAAIVFMDTIVQYFWLHRDFIHDYPAFKYVNVFYLDEFNLRHTEYFIGFPTGPFPFPNDLSAWLLVIMPVMLAISFFDLKKMKSKYPIAALSLVGAYIFVLAKARGAWLAFILSVFSSVFLVRKKIIVFLVLAVMFILILACFLNSMHVIFGFSTILDRGEMWTNGVKIFKEHPVIGNGINTFFNKYRYVRQDKDRGRGSYAHNCYLQMAADVGVLGLGAFLWFIFSIFKPAIIFLKSAKNEFYYTLMLGLTLGIEAFLLHSAVDTNLYSLNLAALFWLSAGSLIAVIKIAGSPGR